MPVQNSKVFPGYAMKALSLTPHILNHAPEGGERSTSHPYHSTPRKRTLVSTKHEDG